MHADNVKKAFASLDPVRRSIEELHRVPDLNGFEHECLKNLMFWTLLLARSLAGRIDGEQYAKILEQLKIEAGKVCDPASNKIQ